MLLYLLRDVIGADELTVIFAATKHHVEYLQLVSQTVPTFRNVVCDFFSKSWGFFFFFKSLYSVSLVFCYPFVWYFELNMSHFHICSALLGKRSDHSIISSYKKANFVKIGF